MSKKFQRIKCGDPNCNCTIAFKVEDNVEITCRRCGKKNIVSKIVQFERVEPELLSAKIN